MTVRNLDTAFDETAINVTALNARAGALTMPMSAYSNATQRVRVARVTTPDEFAPAAAPPQRTVSKYKAALLLFFLFLLPVATGLALRSTNRSGHAQHLPAEVRVPVQQLAVAAETQNQTAALELAASPTKTESPSGPVLASAVWSVIADQTQHVSQAENALVAEDGVAVEIAPGGQLALAYLDGKYFGNGPGADLRIHGAANVHVSYTVFVRNEATAAWQQIDINRSDFPQGVKGHDMGHHGVSQARQILIRNDADTALPVDFLCVAYKDRGVTQAAHQHHSGMRAKSGTRMKPAVRVKPNARAKSNAREKKD